MATRKKTNSIQLTVDAYANQRDREIKLREAISKATALKQEASAALVAHVKATTPGGKVAFQAANGDTLVVSPQYGGSVDTIQPGAQKLPEPPKPATASITDDVVKALLDGKADIAQKIIAEAMLGTNATGGGGNKTATEIGIGLHGARASGVILDDLVTRNYGEIEARMAGHQLDMYQFVYPRVFRSLWGFENLPRYAGFMTGRWSSAAPAIEQQTYKSATMGPIALSKRAKDLLVQNRGAIQAAVGKSDYNANGMEVSKSRGMLAQYISELEQRVKGLAAELATQRYRKG